MTEKFKMTGYQDSSMYSTGTDTGLSIPVSQFNVDKSDNELSKDSWGWDDQFDHKSVRN